MASNTGTRRPLSPVKAPAPPKPSLGAGVRLRRILVVAALFALIPVAFSYAQAMTQTSNSSFGVRTVEWLRDHGAAGAVAKVESIYYGLTAPSTGGPGLHALPQVGFGAATGPRRRSHSLTGALTGFRPADVTPLFPSGLAGEGVWRSTRAGAGPNAPLLVTTLRNQPDYPRVVAGLAYIDTHRTTVTLNPGRLEPAVSIDRGAMEVPPAARGRLLATFNSGFKLSDSRGGFALNGRTYSSLVDGEATLVGYRDGRVDVVDWKGGPQVGGSVAFARQNLPLIVDGSAPNPNLSGGPEWGATLGNAVLVWRSAIGIDKRGNLIYVAGDNQTARSLANTLIRAGAVRAMELDINSYWVSFISYGAVGAGAPLNLLPDMHRGATRYLTPDDRDFFAVYSR